MHQIDLNTYIKEERIPFDLEYFNKITKSRLPPKTLNIALVGTNVISLCLCVTWLQTASIRRNVLYITLGIAEER